ncbi:MAG: hypothetical protein AAF721_18345 [Myxococcota bacterium]
MVAALGLGLGVACDRDRRGPIECGDEECDGETEVCNVNEACSGEGMTVQSCGDIPDRCDGDDLGRCLGSLCSEGEGGGYTCANACG